MNGQLRQQARKLASEPYSIKYLSDETTEGQPIHLASHPELPGCMAQGATMEAARLNLGEATQEYILRLLEDGLQVPTPKSRATTSSGGTDPLRFSVPSGTSVPDPQRPIPPEQRQKLLEVSLKE